MKAVGILFGFLGFSNILFSYNPKDKAFWESAYFVTNAMVKSLHGIVVSILYCFCSPDVRLAFAKKLYRIKVRWHSRNIRRDNSKRFRQSQRGLSSVGTVNFTRGKSGFGKNDQKGGQNWLRQKPTFWPTPPGQKATSLGMRYNGSDEAKMTMNFLNNEKKAQMNKSNGHFVSKIVIHSAPSAPTVSSTPEHNKIVRESSV